MIDLGVAIDFGDWEIPIIYANSGEQHYDDDGLPIINPKTQSTIRGKIQPVNGRDLRDMPEGKRDEALMVVGTRSKVSLDDIIIDNRDGRKYLAIYIIPSTIGGQRTRAILGLLKKQ